MAKVKCFGFNVQVVVQVHTGFGVLFHCPSGQSLCSDFPVHVVGLSYEDLLTVIVKPVSDNKMSNPSFITMIIQTIFIAVSSMFSSPDCMTFSVHIYILCQ